MKRYITADKALIRWPRLARVLASLAIATRNEVACFLSHAHNAGTAECAGPEAFTHSGRTARSWLKQALMFRNRISA